MKDFRLAAQNVNVIIFVQFLKCEILMSGKERRRF
jgi:hypothetical protein